LSIDLHFLLNLGRLFSNIKWNNMKTKLLLLLLIFGTSFLSFSNNLVLSAGTRIVPYSSNTISFSVSWDNSWNVSGDPGNHDAIWIFAKYRECGTSGAWNHALLSTTMANHTVSASLAFAKPILTTDKWGNAGAFNNGCLIKRSGFGVGTTTGTVTLNIVGSATGVVLNPAVEYDIAIYGIEMVQVRQGNNTVGDGTASAYSFSAMPISNTSPHIFTSEGTVQIVTYQGNYTVNVPNNFPKGYDEFYCMKYEITQGQYVDFLNNIGALASARYPGSGSATYMFGINLSGGAYTTLGTTAGDVTDRAGNYLSAQDVMSYLDWSALRPMTEFEYERACRGNGGVLQGDFAWGSAGAAGIVEGNAVTGATSGIEVCSTVNANCNYYGAGAITITGGAFGAGAYGPMAAGIFARDATVTRVTTGATYWGIMEMTGNVWEFTISPNTNNANPSTASAYTGLWGDGQLDASGLYNTSNWPSGTTPYYYRGGSWYTGVGTGTGLSVSSRYNSLLTDYTNRTYDRGGRGVR
jgi:formylglycine-generating enzyme required for sulfatase activity